MCAFWLKTGGKRLSAGDALGPLLMTLYKCCLASSASSAALIGPDGFAILQPLLDPISCIEVAFNMLLTGSFVHTAPVRHEALSLVKSR